MIAWPRLSNFGLDVFSGLFDAGTEAILDTGGNPIPASAIVFGKAAVNFVPDRVIELVSGHEER
jgi:hypothetical protein